MSKNPDLDAVQHPYGDLRPLYDWIRDLTAQARTLPREHCDALRLQALAHRLPGPESVSSLQRTAAANALETLRPRIGWPLYGYLDTLRRREELGIFDEERVSADNFRILLWTPEQRLWITVIEDYRRARDFTAWCVLASVLATLVPEPVSASYDPDNPPFYKRTLDSFADDVITRSRPSSDGRGWYASLDVGPDSQVSDPDFCRYAKTQAAAIALCAAAIRSDAQGIGPYAPHRCFSDYDLHFRLMKHWAAKEQLRQAA